MNKHRLTETKEKNKFGEDFIFTNVFLGIKAETGSIIPKSKKREETMLLLFLLLMMIWFAFQNGEGPIKLLDENQPHHLVAESHGRE